MNNALEILNLQSIIHMDSPPDANSIDNILLATYCKLGEVALLHKLGLI